MDLSGGDNDGLIQARGSKGSPRIPRKKGRGTPHHQNNSIGHSSHRNSSGSSQKRRSNTEVHNTAGRRPGNKIKTPSAATLDDIYSDDSPHRGSSGNRGNRMTHYPENDSSDSSRFSSADSKTAQTSDDDNIRKKQRRKREKEKKQQQLDKERKKKQNTIDKLAESQRQKDAEPECIDLEDDDNASTQGCFDGVVINKPTNAKAKDLVETWRDKFGFTDDDTHETSDRGRGKDKKNFRGNNHTSSLGKPLDRSPDRMVRKDRQQRGYSRRDEQGGRVFYSGSDDPLEQAASQQAADRPARPGKVAISVPHTKQSFTKSMGGFMNKLTSGSASMMSNRNKRKNKPEKNEKREKCARAAISRSDSMDSSSSEGGAHKLSSGEKRKPQYDDRQSSNKRRSRDSSEHDAIDVDVGDDDDGDDILKAVSAAGGQRYTPQSSISRADAALNTSSFGLTKAPAQSRSKMLCVLCCTPFQPIMQYWLILTC